MIAAVLVGEEGALELRAFAASRGGGAWDELRPRIAEETAALGGTATEQEGTFGDRAALPGARPDPRGRAGHPGQPGRRLRGPDLAAARHPDGPARPSSPEPPALGGRRSARPSYAGGREAMAPGSPAAAARCPPEARPRSTRRRARRSRLQAHVRAQEPPARLDQPLGQPGPRRGPRAAQGHPQGRAGLHRRRARPREGRRAGHPQDGDAAPARRRPGAGGRALRRHRLDQRASGSAGAASAASRPVAASGSRAGSASRTATG